MEGLDKLPVLLQIAIFLGILFGSVGATLAGWNRDKLPWAKKEVPSVPSKDAVVLSATIADSQAVHALANAINRLVQRLDEDAQDQRNYMRDMRENQREIRVSLDEFRRELSETNRIMRSNPLLGDPPGH